MGLGPPCDLSPESPAHAPWASVPLSADWMVEDLVSGCFWHQWGPREQSSQLILVQGGVGTCSPSLCPQPEALWPLTSSACLPKAARLSPPLMLVLVRQGHVGRTDSGSREGRGTAVQCPGQVCLLPSVSTHGLTRTGVGAGPASACPVGRGTVVEPLGRVWEPLGGVSAMQDDGHGACSPSR